MSPPAAPPKSLDVGCLRCGALNIPDNRICGACGASLPLVYDEEGKVARAGGGLVDARHVWRPPTRVSPQKIAWALRALVLLFALGVAAFILLKSRQP